MQVAFFSNKEINSWNEATVSLESVYLFHIFEILVYERIDKHGYCSIVVDGSDGSMSILRFFPYLLRLLWQFVFGSASHLKMRNMLEEYFLHLLLHGSALRLGGCQNCGELSG